jgi:hypothetical protein
MHLRRSSPRGFSRQRGAVIVLVLVTLLLAAFLVAAFIRRSGTELLADARANLGRELRAEAYSALESALAIVAAQRAADGELHLVDPEWTEALVRSGYEPAAGREVTVEFYDESARISLPRAEVDVLQSALEGAGLDVSRAEQMARTLRAWMRPGDAEGASDPDAPDYHRHEPAYRSARRPLLAWSELAAVEMDRRLFFDEDGNTTELAQALMRDFSLHAFARSNLNSASASALTALGLGAAEVRALEAHRNFAPDGSEVRAWRSVAEAGAVLGHTALPAWLGTRIEALRLHVTVRQDGVVYRLMAVVGLGGTTGGARLPPDNAAGGERNRLDYPFAVLEIREDLEAPAPFQP